MYCRPKTSISPLSVCKLEIDCVVVTDLYDMMHLHVICTNHGLLTTLAKRWHSETFFFHLSMGEMSIMLEDVWRILHIPIIGELVMYDTQMADVAL